MGVGALRRAVFLDRDGVLNRAIVREGKPYPPATPDEMEIFPEAAAALAELKRLGYLLIVVTNQPDVARGTQSREAVEEMHRRMGAVLPVDEFRTCYHDSADGCPCRKPKPGMLLAAAAEQGIDLPHSFMVGDRWRDMEAGAAAGCRTVWIDRHYQEKGPGTQPSAILKDLREAVAWIVAQSTEEEFSA